MTSKYIKFWGVRGSNPTADKDKMKFGGDTSCVEVRISNNDIVIFDMGSGIRNLGKEIIEDPNSPKTINIFLSHFHFDHVMGFLTFPPLFDKSYTINIYGYNKSTSTKSFSDKILDSTFWPVGLDILQAKINQPFQVTGTEGKFDIKVNVNGGGINGQAEAVRLGISRALVEVNEENRSLLKSEGLLTRDSRMVERKKPGQPKARKKFQFSKR